MAYHKEQWVHKDVFEKQRSLTDEFSGKLYFKEWLIQVVLDTFSYEDLQELYDLVVTWKRQKEGVEDDEWFPFPDEIRPFEDEYANW